MMAFTVKRSSGKWQGRYRDLSGTVRSAGTFEHKHRARQAAEEKESQQRQPGASDPDSGKIRWGDWYDQWCSSRLLSENTAATYDSAERHHIRPYWGKVRLEDIDKISLNRWIKQLDEAGHSPHTIRGALSLMKSSLNAAVDAHRLVRNPADKLRGPTEPEAMERWLSRDEIKRIAFYMNGTDATVLWIAALTGLRFGELAGLHWHRMDLEEGYLHVVEKYNQKSGKIDPLPKDKHQRWVPLSHEAWSLLAEHERNSRGGDEFCGLTHKVGYCRSALVFSGTRGAVLKSNDWARRIFEPALRLAGIHDRVRVHDLRHTYGSWLGQQGLSSDDIADVMGHTDPATTRRYVHRGSVSRDRARRALIDQAASDHEGSSDTQTDTQRAAGIKRVSQPGDTPLRLVIDNDVS